MRHKISINGIGKELERIINNSNLDPSTRSLLGKAMEIGHTLGSLEQKYENQNDPYSSSKCLERYENVKKIIENK